jgi:hypothetical protein
VRDARAVAAIILPIIREAATYTLDPDMSESEVLAYWMGGDKETFVPTKIGWCLAPTICDQENVRAAGPRRYWFYKYDGRPHFMWDDIEVSEQEFWRHVDPGSFTCRRRAAGNEIGR